MAFRGISTTNRLLSLLTRSLLLCALVLVAYGCGGGRKSGGEGVPAEGGVLTVALGDDVGGYFVVGGERYGFVASVTDAVAATMGMTTDVVNSLSIRELNAGLRSGDIDIAAIPSHHRVELHDFPSARLYATDYVLLMPSWTKADTTLTAAQLCRGRRVATDRGFRCHTQSIKELQQSGALIDTTVNDGHSLALHLLQGRCDAIVCERSEAKLVRYLYRNIREVGTFDEQVDIRLIFANRHLKEAFTHQLQLYASTEDYAASTDLYFGQASIAGNFVQLTYRPTRIVGGISVWDNKLQTIGERVGVDWRLLSAMARYESGFRNDQVSNMGAVGLMQVTPIVAEEFKMEEYDLSDPDTNILLAAKLLRKNSRSLGLGNFPSTDDGVALMVASYHCGITRMMEAQRLARATGGSGESWADVSAVLTNMGDVEWLHAHECRMGRFNDHRITIAYTNRVVAAYTTYRQTLRY